MSNITYGIVEETYELNGKSRISYGIAIYADAEKDGTATIIDAIGDISNDIKKVTGLVEKFNCYNLSPAYFRDAVEDNL